jgi:hypothetical protein
MLIQHSISGLLDHSYQLSEADDRQKTLEHRQPNIEELLKLYMDESLRAMHYLTKYEILPDHTCIT